jgi:hypothetical protein
VQSLEACVEGVIGAGLRDKDPLAKVPTSLADVELGLGHFDAAIELIHQAIEAGFRTSLPYRERSWISVSVVDRDNPFVRTPRGDQRLFRLSRRG